MSSNVAPTEHARGHFTSCMVTLKVSFESIFHVHMTIFVLENWKPKRSLLDIRSSLTERKLKVALLEELKMGGVADSPIVCRDLPANAEDYVPIPLGTRFRRWVNVPASRSSQGACGRFLDCTTNGARYVHACELRQERQQRGPRGLRGLAAGRGPDTRSCAAAGSGGTDGESRRSA